MKGNTEKDYRYDAFISYRHLPLDMAVAVKLQTLLETYRPPKNLKNLKRKKINRIFRDQSELPTSGDLGNDIREALLDSRYLIVICSEETKNSLWCMEEIRIFKEAHQGYTDHILTLLVSGEPSEDFPEELLWEPNQDGNLENGTEGVGDWVRIEPLSGDVRARSRSASLKKLKVEFLRIAAPLLGCGFDELYQRHKRRRKRRTAVLAAAGGTLMTAVFLLISVFAYRTWISEGNYRRMLSEEYIRAAGEYTVTEDPQHALLYYTQALSLEPSSASASAGTAILLQDYLWPVKDGEEEGTLNKNLDPPEELGTVLSLCQESYWAFQGNGKIIFYDSDEEKGWQTETPSDYSRGCSPDETDLAIYNASAAMVGKNRGIIAYGGLIHLYDLLEDGTVRETARADLADAFPELAGQEGILLYTGIQLSEDGSIAVVSSGGHAAVYNTDDLTLHAVVSQYFYGLMDAAVSGDGEYFALAYGNLYENDLRNPGSYFEVYDMEGNCLFTSPERSRQVIRGMQFCPEESSGILVWDRENVRLWNWEDGEQTAAPVCAAGIISAAFGESGQILVDTGDGVVEKYGFVQTEDTFSETEDGQYPAEDMDENVLIGDLYQEIEIEDGLTLSLNYGEISLKDSQGVTDTAEFKNNLVSEMFYDPDRQKVYVFSTYSDFLASVEIDREKKTLGSPVEMNTEGVPISTVWSGSGTTVAETAESSLLLYDRNDRFIRKIMPEHAGDVEDICIDEDGRYMAVVIITVQQESGLASYSERGTIELYNLENGILTASFEEPEPVDSVSFDESGMLLWLSGGKVGASRIRMPEADAELTGFLQDLCCLELETDGRITFREPDLSGYGPGSWDKSLGTFGQITSFGTDEEESEDMAVRVNELIDADDFGSSEWFDRCDVLWEEMLEGAQTYTVMEMDGFYAACLTAAQGEQESRLGFGLDIYITLLESALKGEEEVYTDCTANFLNTLEQTVSADKEIAEAFRTMGAILMEDIDPDQIGGYTEETFDINAMNKVMTYYQAEYFFALSGLLEGRGPDALDTLNELAEHPLIQGSDAEVRILRALLGRDGKTAANEADTMVSIYLDGGTDESLIGETVRTWLTSSSMLTWRGVIEPDVLQEFLEEFQADCGLEITALMPEAQEAGLEVGDLVIGVDGTRIAGEGHFRRLREESEDNILNVLRDGLVTEIKIPQGTPFYGNMTVRAER
ncbi:MAG TPA: TIR domain-containing protein [Candidatus Blautia excrementigallinarum]|nr:TIR domain-containing protein [Candidatus Blautia excrementigallinarum]